MRRNKAWWGRLNSQERSELVWLEQGANRGGRSSMIPDDCSECGSCGSPHLGYSLCPLCSRRWRSLITKAEQKEAR